MDHHMDRRVVLSEKSEFKNLYPWFLHEVDSRGASVGGDLIPWEWSFRFTVSELAVSDTLTIETEHGLDNTGETSVQKRQSIGAKLLPKDPWRRSAYTVFSMFGTDRTISEFSLSIVPLEGEGEEKCTVWGSVSYTAEVDFRHETIADTVIFYLYVRPETFADYVAMIRAAEIDEALMRVGGIAGFYSQWSPSISTDKVKVLTDHREHVVELPDNCQIAPPRLGTVREMELDFRRVRKLGVAHDEKDEGDTSDDATEKPSEPHQNAVAAQSVEEVNARIAGLLSSLRKAVWVVIALLVFLLIK